jgi:hypothetical protein
VKIEKRNGHHVAVESGHTRNGSFGEPGGLLTSKIEAVRHSDKHPAARNKCIGRANVDKGTARSDHNSDCIERDHRHPVSMCNQTRRADHGKDQQA